MFKWPAKPNRRRDTYGLRGAVHRQRCLRVVGALAILLSAYGGYWCGSQASSSGFTSLIVWTDQFFRIRSVEITEGQQVAREDVLALLDLSPARGLISTDTQQLKRAVETHPWIQQAEIRRVFPDTLVVEFKEREPAAVLRTGGRDLLIGQDAGVISEANQGTYEGFPILTGVAYAQAKVHNADTTERLLAGIALATLLTEAGAHGTEVDLRVPGDMVAYYDGFRVLFGEGGLEDKMERYRRLTQRIFGSDSPGAGRVPMASAGRKLSDVEVDLRFQDRVIVRDKGGKRAWGEKTKSS